MTFAIQTATRAPQKVVQAPTQSPTPIPTPGQGAPQNLLQSYGGGQVPYAIVLLLQQLQQLQVGRSERGHFFRNDPGTGIEHGRFKTTTNGREERGFYFRNNPGTGIEHGRYRVTADGVRSEKGHFFRNNPGTGIEHGRYKT